MIVGMIVRMGALTLAVGIVVAQIAAALFGNFPLPSSSSFLIELSGSFRKLKCKPFSSKLSQTAI